MGMRLAWQWHELGKEESMGRAERGTCWWDRHERVVSYERPTMV